MTFCLLQLKREVMKYYLNFAKAHPIAAITISVLTLVVAGLLYLLIQSDIRNIETHIANIDKNVSKIESSVTQTNALLIKHIQSRKEGIGPHTHTKNEVFSDTQPKTQKVFFRGFSRVFRGAKKTIWKPPQQEFPPQTRPEDVTKQEASNNEQNKEALELYKIKPSHSSFKFNVDPDVKGVTEEAFKAIWGEEKEDKNPTLLESKKGF